VSSPASLARLLPARRSGSPHPGRASKQAQYKLWENLWCDVGDISPLRGSSLGRERRARMFTDATIECWRGEQAVSSGEMDGIYSQ
jgi:hypothetical protein